MKKENLAPPESTHGRLAFLGALLLLVVGIVIFAFKQSPPPPAAPPAPSPKPAEFAPAPVPPAPVPPATPVTSSSPAPAAEKTAPVKSPEPTSASVTSLDSPPPATPPATPHGGPVIRIAALGNKPVPAAALTEEPWKMREEWRELSVSFFDIGNRVRNGEPPPSELEFPLFDGGAITLTDFEYRPQALPNEGVFFAKVKGEPTGGHVLFSYVNNALVGTIHVPSKSYYYEVRNNTPQGGAASQVFLAQLDPLKMPRCGTCQPASVAAPGKPVATNFGTVRQ